MRAVRAFSRAELEQIAREEYRRHFGDVAPPKVRNATALVALGEHRALRWRGHHYRVSPLSFHAGTALLVCRQVLSDATAPASERERAVRAMLRLARPLLRTRRGHRPLRNPLRRLAAERVGELLDFLLYVPDETPVQPARAGGDIDLIDGLMEYLRGGYPVTPDGLPVSWAHYHYALRHAGRHSARETLRLAQANRVAWVDKDGWKEYSAELRSAGGW
jgi:hypothetical protein